MLSSAGPLDDADKTAALGFAAFLVKPVREAQLHRCLARVLSPPPTATRNPIAQVTFTSTPVAGQLRLLFVEDNPGNQAAMRLLLEKMGYAVTVAGNGQSALAELAWQQFDAVIMDCQMPVLDGYETTRRIRSGREAGINPRVTIIALTANAMAGERQKCLSAGMDDFLTKPVKINALRAVFLRCGLIQSGPSTVEF
jgi:CheY-like chemotaxis protein